MQPDRHEHHEGGTSPGDASSVKGDAGSARRGARSAESGPVRASRCVLLALALATAGSVALGCASGAGPEAPKSEVPADRAVIRAGRGILFRTLAGAPVDARRVVVEPGMQSLRLNVRRNLKELGNPRVHNIYSVGSCRIRLDAKAGSDYEVMAVPFESRRLQFDEGTGPDGEERDFVGVTVRVLDSTLGSEYLAPPDACLLKFDCSRVDRGTLRPGSVCSK